MIFSILKLRKKTATVLSGILIAMACLWGIALWQDLTLRQLLGLFVGSLLLVLAVMLVAIVIVMLGKAITRLVRALLQGDKDSNSQ